MAACVSGAAWAKRASAWMPPARIRPLRLASAWRYHGRSGPPADRTYSSPSARATHIVVNGRSVPSARREARRSSSASPMRASWSAVQVSARSSVPSVCIMSPPGSGT